MPAPVWNWAPQRDDGRYEPGFDRRGVVGGQAPDYQAGWSPQPQQAWPQVTEPGGGMVKGPGAMNGVGDFFQIPPGQGAQQYYEQQVQSGAMAPPPASSPAGQALPPGSPLVTGDPMDEQQLYQQTPPKDVGRMAWEQGPAPWEQVPPVRGMPSALSPDRAGQAVRQAQQSEAQANEDKAVEAAQAAKIAADNAVRAAAAGAPKTASTNAATAQAAANVAAGVARTPKGQKAASVAQSEATKAVAAANVAAKNAGVPTNGQAQNNMDDWLELSGMGGMGDMGFLETDLGAGVKVKHVGLGLLVAGLGYFAVRQFRGR